MICSDPPRQATGHDRRLHHDLADHLHDAVVQNHQPSPETAALAALALTIGLDRHLLPCADRDAVRQRMTEVSAWCGEAGWVTAAVAGAVNAVEAALGTVPGSTAYP